MASKTINTLKSDACFDLYKVTAADLGVKHGYSCPWIMSKSYSLSDLSMKVSIAMCATAFSSLFQSLSCMCSQSSIPSGCANYDIKSCHVVILQVISM